MGKAEILYLTMDEVKSLVSMREVIDAVDRVYKAHGEVKVLVPACETLEICSTAGRNFFVSHPTYIKPIEMAGLKWVSFYRDNPAKGLPLILGLVVLNDTETGMPLAIMDGAIITAMRTAAHQAVAAKYLAKKDSEVIAVIGCGVEGRTHLEAMSVLFDFKEVRIFDIKKEAMDRFAREMGEKLNLKMKSIDSPREAVRGADIVCMVTTALETVVFEEWVEPGCFVAGSTGFLDLDAKLAKKADKWVLGNRESDYRLIVKNPVYGGYRPGLTLSENDVYADMGEIAIGKKPGRETDRERIVYTHLGMGSHDIATANVVYTKAKERGTGTKLIYLFTR